MDRRGRAAFSLLFGTLLSFSPVSGGATADLKGVVTDAAGRPLPGAAVVLRNDGLAIAEQGTTTDPAGTYHFYQLPSGAGYRIRASLPAYASVELTDIELSSEQVLTLDIILRPASEVQETIRVRGRPRVVDTENAVTTASFSSEFVAGLPLLGRDYQDILTLAPGVTDVNETGNPNVHGARDTGVVTLVDGVSTTDPFTGSFGQNLNIESIQEIEVITAGAPAEFSRAQGGFANIITKSGGNEFEGTFKFFLRSNRLDGDGAGIDPPELRGALGEFSGSRGLRFTDLYPFLSLSGPLVRDRAWYYLASEYVQIESPINAVTHAFVTRTRGHREFGKATWQLRPNHRLAFSVILDRTRDENQGITSLNDVGSGYSFIRGGPTYTVKASTVFRPTLLLESSASSFDNSFHRVPTTDPDTNGNGVLFIDRNRDGIFQARERDPGEDYDRDRKYDLFEDFVRNSRLDINEDLDGDGRLTPEGGCEGLDHEDLNCNGIIDQEYDRNLNGAVDADEDQGIPCTIRGLCPEGYVPGSRSNGRFDNEDENVNGILDTLGDSGPTPFPFWEDGNGDGRIDFGEYRSPLPPDLDFLTDEAGRTFGPNPFQFDDHRKRFTLREDFSVYLNNLAGSHDLKLGAIYEHEAFDRDTLRRPIVTGSLVRMGFPPNVNNTAVGDNVGLYLQDTYKPVPNLTFGLGVRVDFENVRSFGYTAFNPEGERNLYDALVGASGVDADPSDDINVVGLFGDPLYGGYTTADFHLAGILSALKKAAPSRLTRHNAEIDIQSEFLSSVLGRDVSIDDLLAAGINPRKPEHIRWTNANLAPRISLSWDPWSDGKSKVFASWNRFYDKLFLNSLILEEGPDVVTRFYAFDVDGVDAGGVPNYQLGATHLQSALSAFQVDRNLATPYTRELTLGLERELAPEFVASVRYVRRDYKGQLQDIDVNHHPRLDPQTGRFVDLLGDVFCPLAEPSCRALGDGLPDLFIENFFFNQVLRLGNFNTQTYRGYELELVRRLSRRWQMKASYTYSRSQGDAETFLSELGNDPSLVGFEPGFLDFDQRHVVKFSAIAYLPRDWRIGGIVQWASGLPYSRIDRADSLDDVGYVQNRIFYGHLDPNLGFIHERRNNNRNRAVYDFNARVEKSFVLGKASASAFFEVFNLLSSDDLRVRTVQPRLGEGLALHGQLRRGRRDFYEIEGERRFGRRFQVGVRIDF